MLQPWNEDILEVDFFLRLINVHCALSSVQCACAHYTYKLKGATARCSWTVFGEFITILNSFTDSYSACVWRHSYYIKNFRAIFIGCRIVNSYSISERGNYTDTGPAECSSIRDIPSFFFRPQRLLGHHQCSGYSIRSKRIIQIIAEQLSLDSTELRR